MHQATISSGNGFAPRLDNAKPNGSAEFERVSNGIVTPDIIARIEIPSLGISAAVTDDITKIELIRGVGHIPGTAFPGGLGTMALAGHRDTFFRNLRRVAPGTEIRVNDSSGSYTYRVDGTTIVTPEQTEVLEIGSEPALVLVTCYPFNYIGAAPKRFIVHAKLLSVAPDTQKL